MIIYLTAIGLAAIVVAFATFFFTLFRHATGANRPSNAWLNEFSMEKYRPLERLFESGDLKFIKSQPGYTPAVGREFAASRRSVARLYLSELSLDFDRLFRMGREMVATSRVDRSDLASQLMMSWLVFHLRVTGLRLRLGLVPLAMPTHRPAGLFEAMARMRNVVAVLEVPSAA